MARKLRYVRYQVVMDVRQERMGYRPDRHCKVQSHRHRRCESVCALQLFLRHLWLDKYMTLHRRPRQRISRKRRSME